MIRKLKKSFRDMQDVIEALKNFKTLLRIARQADSLQEQLVNFQKRYPSIDSIEAACQGLQSASSHSMSLDIGCGAEPRNPFGAPKLVGVDIRENLGAGVVRADITIEKLPFEANTFDSCTAFDLIEHIPRVVAAGEGSRNPFIELMNEIHRVLKPEGIFLHRTPAFPSRQVFQDPTHVNFITEDTIPYYFCEPDLFAVKMGYGFEGRFELISQSWLWDAWLVGVMRAKK